MTQKALVNVSDVVVNVIEWPDTNPDGWAAPDGVTLVDATEGCAIGATYNPEDGTFTPPAPPDPPAPPTPPPTGDQFAALQAAVATLTASQLGGS